MTQNRTSASSSLAGRSEVRARLTQRLAQQRGRLVSLCSELGCIDSQNPPGDTTAIAAACRRLLESFAGISVETVVRTEPMANLVARLPGAGSGPRLVFNGHLDTGPVPEPSRWSVPPFGGVMKDGRIYGRGISDMKAGIAAQVLAMATLSEFRADLRGELVLVLVADEGTGGRNGTQHILATRPELCGDAMLSGDVGSPLVGRVGEKGFVWIEVAAQGRSAPGAAPHLGINAIERLLPALEVLRALNGIQAPMPAGMQTSIESAAHLSDLQRDKDEIDTLTHVTVNIGMIEGGHRINNVPSNASARIDVRIPPGLTTEIIRTWIREGLDALPGVTWQVLDEANPNWTSPDVDIVQMLKRNAEATLARPIGLSIRSGFSDSRFFRQRNVPTVVYGVTPQNSNAPDEFVLVADLEAIFQVHALTAFDYLA